MSIIINRVLASGRAPTGNAPPSTDDLSSLTVSELRSVCAECGIAMPRRTRKADLIAAIEAHRGR